MKLILWGRLDALTNSPLFLASPDEKKKPLRNLNHVNPLPSRFIQRSWTIRTLMAEPSTSPIPRTPTWWRTIQSIGQKIIQVVSNVLYHDVGRSLLLLFLHPSLYPHHHYAETEIWSSHTKLFALPGQNSSRDAEEEHEDDVDNIGVDEDRDEVALARHQVADKEEGEGEGAEQGEQQSQCWRGHRQVRHHLREQP